MRYILPLWMVVANIGAAQSLPVIPSVTKNLEVQYSPEAEVETLLENKAVLTDVGNTLNVQSTQRGSISVTFSRTYSNPCIASLHIVLPEASLENDRVKIALGQAYRKMMCPMVAKPILVRYQAKVRGLKAGGTYRVTVGVKGKLAKKLVKVK